MNSARTTTFCTLGCPLATNLVDPVLYTGTTEYLPRVHFLFIDEAYYRHCRGCSAAGRWVCVWSAQRRKDSESLCFCRGVQFWRPATTSMTRWNVSAALEIGCTTLYSEDLHDGQTIDGQLTIRNPFVGSSASKLVKGTAYGQKRGSSRSARQAPFAHCRS